MALILIHTEVTRSTGVLIADILRQRFQTAASGLVGMGFAFIQIYVLFRLFFYFITEAISAAKNTNNKISLSTLEQIFNTLSSFVLLS